jgi:hypothetical protein
MRTYGNHGVEPSGGKSSDPLVHVQMYQVYAVQPFGGKSLDPLVHVLMYQVLHYV